MSSSWFLLLLTFCASACLAGNICYFPNGEQSSDVPCNATAEASHCCGNIDACLSNGLCALEATENSGISYARGTCTERSWDSPFCPANCQLNQDTPTNSSAYDFRADGVQIWECGSQGFGKKAEYCCESEGEKLRCCSTTTAVFTLDAASIGPFTGVATTTSSSASVSTSITASSATPSATGSTLGSPTASSAAASPQDSNDNGNAAKIGGGVGGAVGGCLLVAGLVFLIRRHKRGNGKSATGFAKHEMDANHEKQYYGSRQPWIRPGEMDASREAQELPVHERIHELPGPQPKLSNP